MKYILILFNFLFVNSQEVLILDQITYKPIAFTSISYFDHDKVVFGDYSDESGNYKLKSNVKYEYIEFSCIGYNAKHFIKSKLKDTIFLEKAIYHLQEVVITNTRTKVIGYYDKRKTSYRGVNKGELAVVFIPNEDKESLRVVSFLLTPKKVKERRAFRLHFYEASNDKLWPGEKISYDNIIGYIEPDSKGLIEIDLSDYGIIMPKDGIYVGVEALGVCDNEGNILSEFQNSGLSFEVYHSKELIYYYRPLFFKEKSWININERILYDFKNVFNAKPNKKDLVAPSFGLKVIMP